MLFPKSPELSPISTCIIEIALGYLGADSKLYTNPTSGIDAKDGFDCSGFVYRVLQDTKFYHPELNLSESIRHASNMFDHLGCYISREYALPGDLVFYTRSGKTPSHVAIFVGYNAFGNRIEIGSEGITGGRVCLDFIRDLPLKRNATSTTIYSSSLIGYKRLTVKFDSDNRWTTRFIK